MTSATGRDPHPDVMEIADSAEGILPPEQAAEVRAHVESCAQCGEVLASLAEIRDLLGDLPEPEPMPADVVARIDAALIAAARFDSALPHVPRETLLPTQATGEAADVPRGTSAPAGRPSAPTGPGRGRRHRRALLLSAASTAAVLALGGAVYELSSHSGSHAASADSSAQQKAGAQGGGDADAVGDEVTQLLDAAGGKTGSGGVTSPMLSPRGEARITGPDGTVITVPGCVLKATQRVQQPLAANRELYEGVDSFLVVFPDPDATQVDAFVVTATCTADTPARVLFQGAYPRG